MPLPSELLVTPYLSIGPLLFDMNPREVEALMGPPQLIRTNRRGERDERRAGIALRYDKDTAGLVEVSIARGPTVLIQGVSIFCSVNPLASLAAIDPSCYECLGDVVFFSLGMVVPLSILDADPTPWITIFVRGRWDSMKAKCKPFIPHLSQG
jgi:hypothetical protein